MTFAATYLSTPPVSATIVHHAKLAEFRITVLQGFSMGSSCKNFKCG